MSSTTISDQCLEDFDSIQSSIARHLTPETRDGILGTNLAPLIKTGSGKTLVSLALYSDLLRIIVDSIHADGEANDQELQEAFSVLQRIAGSFARVRSEYSPYANLSPMNALSFLNFYKSDKGAFGYPVQTTKYSGIAICENVAQHFSDSIPLHQYTKLLWQCAVAIIGSDGVTPPERKYLEELSKKLRIPGVHGYEINAIPATSIDTAIAGAESQDNNDDSCEDDSRFAVEESGIFTIANTMLECNDKLYVSKMISSFTLCINQLRIDYRPKAFGPGEISFSIMKDDPSSWASPIEKAEFKSLLDKVLSRFQELLMTRGESGVEEIDLDGEEADGNLDENLEGGEEADESNLSDEVVIVDTAKKFFNADFNQGYTCDEDAVTTDIKENYKDDKAIEWIAQYLTSESSIKRSMAAKAMADVCNAKPHVIQRLAEMQGDEDGDVALEAARSLFSIGALCVPYIVKQLESNDSLVIARSANILMNLDVGDISEYAHELVLKINPHLIQCVPQECYEENVRLSSIYALRGRAFGILGEIQSAINDFSMATKLFSSLDSGYWQDLAQLRSIQSDASLGSALESYFKGTEAESYEEQKKCYMNSIQADQNFPWGYNNLAWLLATCSDEKIRNGPVAVKAAKRACDLSDWRCYGILDTLAAALAEDDQFDEAAATMKKAIAVAPESEKEAYEYYLQLYLGGNKWHERPEELVGGEEDSADESVWEFNDVDTNQGSEDGRDRSYLLVPLDDFVQKAGFSGHDLAIINESKTKTWWDKGWDKGFKVTIGTKLSELGFCDDPGQLEGFVMNMGDGPLFNYRLFKVHESFVSIDHKIGDLPDHEGEWFIKIYDKEEGTTPYQRLCKLLGVRAIQRYNWSVVD